MWDVYFLHGDQFLALFMALVILVNARYVYYLHITFLLFL